MPVTRVQTKAEKQDDSLIFLTLKVDGFSPITMSVLRTMTLEEAFQLALQQPRTPDPDPFFDGAFDLTWHNETHIDPETGETYTAPKLDDIERVT